MTRKIVQISPAIGDGEWHLFALDEHGVLWVSICGIWNWSRVPPLPVEEDGPF